LLQNVLLYSLSPHDRLVDSINNQIKLLSEEIASHHPSTLRADFVLVINHAQTILQRKPEIDKLTIDLVAVPTATHAEKLYSLYNRHYESSLRLSTFYRLCLYTVSVGFALPDYSEVETGKSATESGK
jgi:hypothetical protein